MTDGASNVFDTLTGVCSTHRHQLPATTYLIKHVKWAALSPCFTTVISTPTVHTVHRLKTCWLFLTTEQWLMVVHSWLPHLKYGTVFWKTLETVKLQALLERTRKLTFSARTRTSQPLMHTQIAVLDWILALYKSCCYNYQHAHTHTHTHARLTALCPGLTRWAGTRKVKPIWILLKQETVSGSGISWAICKSAPCSRQITTPAPHHSLFYRLDALPAAQPTVSKHWRNIIQHTY